MWRKLAKELSAPWPKTPPHEQSRGLKPETKQQKKSWVQLTEEERQAIRESWKHELPAEYDVYCTNKVFAPKTHALTEMVIPGRFYASGNVVCKHNFSVDETCTIDGSLKCFSLNVGGTLYVGGNVRTDDVLLSEEAIICGYTMCDNLDTLGNFTSYGDVHCEDIKCEKDFTVDGNFDCAHADIKGFLDVNGDASASFEINVDGGISIAGDTAFEDVYSGDDFHVGGYAKCGDIFAKGNITFVGGADCLVVEAEGKITVKGKTHFESVTAGSVEL